MATSSKALELRERRAGLINTARSIVDAAEAEDRALDAAEEERYAKLWDDINDLQARADRMDRQAQAEAELETVRRAIGPNGDRGVSRPELEERLSGVRSDIRAAVLAYTEERAALGTEDYRAAHAAFLRSGERRDLMAGSDPKGGFLVPSVFIAELLEKVRDMVVVEQFATVQLLPTGDSLGRPTLENDPADADWTSELATGSEDSTMSFGKRELYPGPLAKLIKVSRTLMRRSPLGVEAIVRDRLAYKFGITREKGFFTGDGVNGPLGIFTASADGIPTSRDVSTGNTTTAFTADGLKEAKWSLKGGYLMNARWLFHRDGMKALDKLKDGEGNYLLQPDIRQGTGDVLLGRPVLVSEYVPNTFTSGNYVGAIGDLRYYWIADSLAFTIQRLDELYAATNQVGFIGRAETDAMPVFGEAFARVTLA